ncbi:hypothetical protein D915_008112 [Fasciola hepatica]|uniref:Uncharacterized protein n=1 Tax=Fasciola hepatica TaxID=6192 RepID=A0A4E0RJY4_FASHE|nr:hypothetical protein D915_008112 [Fasciola hepatica]
MIYGSTGVDGLNSTDPNQTLGVSPVEMSSTGCSSVCVLESLRHSGPENCVSPTFTATGFSLGFFGGLDATSPFITTGFPTCIQPLSLNLQMVERALHYPIFTKNVCSAVNEISQETKGFRESMGLLLPQDL